MAEYIEREAAIGSATHAWAKGIEPAQYIELIPAADVAPVRHGRWVAVRRTNASTAYQCSVCGRRVSVMKTGAAVWDHYPYCHCGAKMDADKQPAEEG